MKSLSCLSLSSPHEPASPTLLHHIPDDTYKHTITRTTDLGNKGPKLQTIIQVLRCELARPGRQAQNGAFPPSKHWTPVHFAAFHNREAALVHFLQRGHSPDGNSSADSPLCIAVVAGHIGAVRILNQAGADVNRSTHERGETPLHLAIKSGRPDIFDELLLHGPDLTSQAKETGETVLHYAAGNAGSLAVVVNLLKSGANYELLNAQGCTAAEVAIKSGNIHAAVAIIGAARGNRRKLAKEKEMLLRHVENAQNRFSLKNELIADIFEASIDPDSTVLVEAIKRDDLSLAKLFLERGVDPNRPTQSGSRPIFVALNCSGAKMVQLLVDQDLDVTIRDSDGLTVLQAVLESPSAHDKEAALGIFEALLSKGAEATVSYSDGKTLLHHVAGPELGLSRVVPLLIQCGVEVNGIDNSGCTALHLASHSKSCIEALIKHGADASITNHNGLTPLLSALNTITKDSETDLESLIKKSDLRAVDSEHKTALHLACERGLERTVRALLKCRAETMLIDNKARTPLILAVINQRWNVVPLLATQPGVNTWDKEGMTALHHAVRCIPIAPSTWKEVAFTVRRFCERGASRSMRDRSGATPLIRAVTTLPEDGLPVIDVLLADTTGGRGNCVDHEDHKQKSALYFAATLGKPSFVRALLKSGASFVFKEWTPANGPLRPNTTTDKQTLKLLAESEWLRRAGLLQRKSGEATATPVLPKVLPIRDLKELLSMGLDPNVLPFPSKSTYTGLLLWLVLNQTLIPPPLPPKYLYDVLKLILAHGADPNATAVRTSNGARSSSQSLAKLPLGCHPLAFLLEQYPAVDIDLILLFL
ncbi:ankyrin repeat-containing domain protein, partial [Lophiotrema nucula]